MRADRDNALLSGVLADPTMSEEWRPSKSKLVLVREAAGGGLEVYVDPGKPDAWRAEPFSSALRRLAISMAANMQFITIYVGKKAYALVGYQEFYVGILQDDEVVATDGITAYKVKRDDSLIANPFPTKSP